MTEVDTGACKGASCRFTVTMRWRTPPGAPIDFCHSYGGNTYCAPTEVGTGLEESEEHPSSQLCNDMLHSYSATGFTPCGLIQSSVQATCTACAEGEQ